MNRQVPYVIFSDLDGSLLDEDSYSTCGAEPALERIQAHKVPLVLCTSQTRAEVEALRGEIGNREPFIVENGAAIFIPQGYFPFPIPAWKTSGTCDVVELGVPYTEVVAKLHHAAELTGCSIRAFSDMTVAQVALLCRMSIRAAEFAKQREYDEPFEVLSQSHAIISSFFERLEEEGLTWTRGGRFYHLRGKHNKGQAVQVLIAFYRRWYPETITVGIGDGPNDISLLESVDVPIVIPGRVPALSAAQHNTGVADFPGPKGWNQAVLELFDRSGALGATGGA